MGSLQQLDILDPRWIECVNLLPDSMVFHHPAWSQLMSRCYGYKPMVVASADARGQILAGLPIMEVSSRLTGRRLVALPFSDAVPPLSRGQAALADFSRSLGTWRQALGVKRLDVHWELPDEDGIFHRQPVARHLTRLALDPGAVLAGFRKATVRLTRQAESAGVTTRFASSWDDVLLYCGLHVQTRKRLGAPSQPLRFFRLLWDLVLTKGLGFVLLAYRGDELLAGGVFLHWNGVLTYKYGASDPSYWSLRPNNLLFWHAIQWGCEHGYGIFDWGRTDLKDSGLLQFKRGWGTEEKLVRYSVLADQPPSQELAGRAGHYLSSIIRRSPSWVCRGIGELFYAHSA